jgi:hypothetical protein
MAISFSEGGNKQKYLIILLVIIVLVCLFTLRKNIFKISNETLFTPEVFSAKDIEINFDVLKKDIIKELNLPEPEVPFSGQAGRDDPFLPY